MGGNPVPAGFLITALFCGLSPECAFAEPTQVAVQKSAILDQIEQSVFSVVQKRCDRVEVQATKVELAVILVNCSGESLRGRDAEARWVSDIVTKTISGKDGFRTVATLHVDYVACDKNGKYLRQIDELDFFKDMQGKFQLRTS